MHHNKQLLVNSAVTKEVNFNQSALMEFIRLKSSRLQDSQTWYTPQTRLAGTEMSAKVEINKSMVTSLFK